MLNLLLFIFLNISYNSNELENSSWISEFNGVYEVRIYTDKFFSIAQYDISNNKFIGTSGGIYSIDNGYYEVIEFNSLDSSFVGDTIYYSDFTFFNEVFEDGDEEVDVVYLKINNIKYLPNISNYNQDDNLNGSWLMSGIERRGEMRMRDVNRPRKTLKMLAGGRFQWIDYDTSKKGIYGTGGGTYTLLDGKYVENIEFFSRDSKTVGKSLVFDYEIKEGDWHHKGFSSRGKKYFKFYY